MFKYSTAKGSIQIIMEIYRQHILKNTPNFISLDDIPNIEDRLKTIRELSKKYFVEYDESEGKCKLVTGEAFAKPYLNTICKFDKAYDLLSILRKLSNNNWNQTFINNNDKIVIKAAEKYIKTKKFKNTAGAIYLISLLTAIKIEKLGFSRKDIKEKYPDLYKKTEILAKKDNWMREYEFICENGVDDRIGFRAPAAKMNMYKIEIDIAKIELALFKHMINIYRTNDNCIFVMPFEEVYNIYTELKKLPANLQEQLKHTPKFFKKSQVRDSVLPLLAETQNKLLTQIKGLTNLVRNPNDLEQIINLLEEIQKTANVEVKEVLSEIESQSKKFNL